MYTVCASCHTSTCTVDATSSTRMTAGSGVLLNMEVGIRKRA